MKRDMRMGPMDLGRFRRLLTSHWVALDEPVSARLVLVYALPSGERINGRVYDPPKGFVGTAYEAWQQMPAEAA